MGLSFALFLLSFYVLQLDLHAFLAPQVEYLHGQCLSLLPDTAFPQIYEALVCGERLKDAKYTLVFVTTGLLHIFVVSGTHLSRLRKCLSWIGIPFWVQACLLAVYGLATNLHPPVVRAWFALCLAFANERFVLNWNPTLLVWHVSFLALLFFSSWSDSFSFLLSWSASLALALGRDKSLLTKNLIVYLVMAPILAGVSHPHPVSVLINTLFLPIFGLFFFPMTLCSVLIPPLTWIMDRAWAIFFHILSVICQDLPLFQSDIQFQEGFFYLLFLHILIALRSFWLRRVL